MDRVVNALGLALLKESEGCRLEAYPDPGTGSEPFTIGYGHTGADVYSGMVINQPMADQLLQKDLCKFQNAVNSLVTSAVNDNQFSAMVVFTYNVGITSFKLSHLLIKVNNEDFSGAADEFLKWNKSGGKAMAGLTTRRENERRLFLKLTDDV